MWKGSGKDKGIEGSALKRKKFYKKLIRKVMEPVGLEKC